MKIFTLGAKHWGGQLPRIEQGFRELGHEITANIEEADLAYANNPPFGELIDARQRGRTKAKLIFTVLDIPEHIPDFDLGALQRELAHADAICSISTFVQGQLHRFLSRDSAIIYQPIKPVFRDSNVVKLSYRYLHVGRRSDINKRFSWAQAAMQILGESERKLALIGNEPMRWGDWHGVQSDADLNRFYNSVDFVFTLGKIEGLSLPTLEAMAAGAIPVVCNDMTTTNELLPVIFFPEYASVNPNPRDIALFVARYLQDPALMQIMKDHLHGYFNRHWREKTSPKGVAQAILNLYDRL